MPIVSCGSGSWRAATAASSAALAVRVKALSAGCCSIDSASASSRLRAAWASAGCGWATASASAVVTDPRQGEAKGFKGVFLPGQAKAREGLRPPRPQYLVSDVRNEPADPKSVG